MEFTLILTNLHTSVIPVTIVVVTVILLIVLNHQKRYKNLPPGPRGYPIVGNVFDITHENILGIFRNLRREYGDLFTVYLGTEPTIVVNGYENIIGLFTKKADSVSDRPPNFHFKELLKESGISASSGPLWKTHRTFTLVAMGSFGFNRRRIESNILEEVNAFLNDIEKQNGRPFNIHELVHVCVSNVICSILLGERFDHEDSRFKTLLRLIKDLVNNAAVLGPMSAFSFLKYLPGDIFSAKRVLRNFKEVKDFIQNIINEHKMTFDPENVRDYIDLYLKEQAERSGSEKDTFTDEQLTATVTDLFSAGTETTATVLKWFILYLLHYPKVQKKMATEIESVVGASRFPSLEDKPNLPYCEAVNAELLRCANITPISLMHCANRDLEMNGYTIPKGSILLKNLDSIMKDPALFPDPEEFRPERFIDHEGKFRAQDRVVPFSLGRRKCLAESFARSELFLFSTSLVQRFTLASVEGKPLPPLEGKLGTTYMPNPFHFIAVKRQ